MLKKILTTICLTMCLASTTYAANITSYSFADIAGKVEGDTITVKVPYKTRTTYWDHKVQVDEGSSFQCGYLNEIDEYTTEGTITVFSSDRSESRDYTVTITKAEYQEPEVKLEKISGITKNKAKVRLTYEPGDATVRTARVCYYTGKNSKSPSYVSINTTGSQTVELNGLKADTKYYCYLEVVTEKKTYTTGSKNFRTKENTTTSSTEATKEDAAKPTEKYTGPNVQPVSDNVARNMWKQINGKYYYFGPDGYAVRGWFKVTDKWYYANPITSDLVTSGWRQIDDRWYYFDAAGTMLANQWVYSEPSKSWYWLGDSGTMVRSQWIEVGGVKYLLAPDGKCMDNTFVCENGRFMYLKSGATGLARNESFTYNGHTYHADGDGYVY